MCMFVWAKELNERTGGCVLMNCHSVICSDWETDSMSVQCVTDLWFARI